MERDVVLRSSDAVTRPIKEGIHNTKLIDLSSEEGEWVFDGEMLLPNGYLRVESNKISFGCCVVNIVCHVVVNT